MDKMYIVFNIEDMSVINTVYWPPSLNPTAFRELYPEADRGLKSGEYAIFTYNRVK